MALSEISYDSRCDLSCCKSCELRRDAKTLDTFCLDQIARFKRPKRYVFVESLPKNNYGKVLKTVLRERA
jgi:acyl-CoA synthetase (AMP-forming)/AMP-acid ligase II